MPARRRKLCLLNVTNNDNNNNNVLTLLDFRLYNFKYASPLRLLSTFSPKKMKLFYSPFLDLSVYNCNKVNDNRTCYLKYSTRIVYLVILFYASILHVLQLLISLYCVTCIYALWKTY